MMKIETVLIKAKDAKSKVKNTKVLDELEKKTLAAFKTFELIMFLNLQALEIDGRMSFSELTGFDEL